MTVDESYEHCARISRESGSNFYYAFRLFPPARRRALYAVYAFNRHSDDLSDEADVSEAALEKWSRELDLTLSGTVADHPIWPALHDAVTRYAIPHECFRAMIDGVRGDLRPVHIATFEELREYCYRVASVVGLMVIHIAGFREPKAVELAQECGLAVQLTNILRDVREDAERGRVYLPEEDMARFDVTEVDLIASSPNAAFLNLIRFEADRARRHFAAAPRLLELIEPESRRAVWAILEVYSRLLARIHHRGYNVLQKRVRVPGWEKLWILARASLT
jgi:phytoene synthase